MWKQSQLIIGTCVLSLTATWAIAEVYLYLRKTQKKKFCLQFFDHQVETIVENPADWEEICPHFQASCQKLKVIGFDCEWTESNGPVSLIQLGTSDGICVLFRLCKFQPGQIPQSLIDILADASILKVGVSPHMDAKKLWNFHNICVNSYLDLGWLAFDATNNNVPSYGLKGLALHFLKIKLDKSFEVRCSNWDADVLSQRQITYAARDAYVAVKLFQEISSLRLTLWNRISSGYNEPSWNQHPSVLMWLNLPFNASKVQQTKIINKSPQPKKPKVLKLKAGGVRKSPLYHNCILQAPDGQPLCTCGTSKAQWYLDQSLADLVCENPLTVRLRFEPSGRPEDENDYYLQCKDNICVVCGSDVSLIRKHIVPLEYRRHFPANLKEHKSHDVILLCLRCHQMSNMRDLALKQKLATQYEAPAGSGENSRVTCDTKLKAVRSAARALSNPLPDKRRQELEAVLKEYYQVEELTDDIINTAKDIDFT